MDCEHADKVVARILCNGQGKSSGTCGVEEIPEDDISFDDKTQKKINEPIEDRDQIEKSNMKDIAKDKDRQYVQK